MDEDEAPLSPLRPASDVQKYLIAATCHLSGRFTHANFLVTDAQPAISDYAQRARMDNETTSRTALALIFRTDPSQQGGLMIPQYEGSAEWVCCVFTLFFGKRFDSLGPVENSGFYYLPNLRALDLVHDRRLPQNGNRVRADFPATLDLAEVERMLPVLFRQLPAETMAPLASAIKFYRQALLSAEQDWEIAYLHLITAGEILSGLVELEPDELVDAATRTLLDRIGRALDDDGASARQIRSKLRSIRRRFVIGLGSLVDDRFFHVAEATHGYARFRATGMARTLAAAYDLRSAYLHTGRGFGFWVSPRGIDYDEIPHGKPVFDDREWVKTLASAPTFIGLERLMRYCLLRFIQLQGIDVGPLSSEPADTSAQDQSSG